MANNRAGSSLFTYSDFELLISPATAQGYPVRLLYTPIGELSEPVYCQIDPLAVNLRDALERLAKDDTDREFIKTLGAQLFDSLFVGDVANFFRNSLVHCRASGQCLRVRLRFEAADLAALPWEYLYDSIQNIVLGRSAEIALSRYIPQPRSARPATVNLPLRILVAIAAPQDQAALNNDREKQNIETALAPLVGAKQAEVIYLTHTTLSKLRDVIREHRPHVFHYIGHALWQADGTQILLEDDYGDSHPVNDEVFAELFDNAPDMRLAVLNACQTGVVSARQASLGLAPRLLQKQLAAVVAMQFPIPDRAAAHFAREFYRELAQFHSVEQALSEARQGIFLESDTEHWGTPVLYLRASDGELFQRSRILELSKLPLWLKAASILTLLGVMTVIGLFLYQIRPVPIEPMTGEFNIAVLPFLESSETGFKPGDTGVRVSQLIASRLGATAGELLGDENISTQVRGPDSFQVFNATSLIDLETQVQAQASAIKAQVIVYGVIEPNEFGGFTIRPRFYLSPDAFGDASDLLGDHQLGAPIRISSEGSSGAEQIDSNRDLQARVQILSFLLKALGVYIAEDFDAAQSYVEKARASELWSDTTGLDVIWLISGNIAARADDYEKAENAYNQARQLNPTSARPLVGLAGLEFRKALGDIKAGTFDTVKHEGIAKAEDLLDQAEQMSGQLETADIPVKIAFLRGQIYLLRSQLESRQDLLVQSYDQFAKVASLYGEGQNPRVRELTAQSHGGLALIARINYDQNNTAVTELDTAISEYELAIRLTYIPSRKILYIANLGTVYDLKGDTVKALQYYKEALSDKPTLAKLMSDQQIQGIEDRVTELMAQQG